MIKEKDLCKFMIALLKRCKNIDSFASVEVKKDLSDIDFDKKIDPKELLSEASANGLIKYTYLCDKLTITILDKGKLFYHQYKEKRETKIKADITFITAVLGAVFGLITLLHLLLS